MSAFSHAQLTIVGCECVFALVSGCSEVVALCPLACRRHPTVVALLSTRCVAAVATLRLLDASPGLARRADSDKWLWEEAALGTGGENICFDPLGLHTRAMVTDVRVKLFDGAWKVRRPPRPRKARLVRSPLHSHTLWSLGSSHCVCWLPVSLGGRKTSAAATS